MIIYFEAILPLSQDPNRELQTFEHGESSNSSRMEPSDYLQSSGEYAYIGFSSIDE